MNNKKRLAKCNIIAGYIMMCIFIALVLLNRQTRQDKEVIAIADENKNDEQTKEVVYIDRYVATDNRRRTLLDDTVDISLRNSGTVKRDIADTLIDITDIENFRERRNTNEKHTERHSSSDTIFYRNNDNIHNVYGRTNAYTERIGGELDTNLLDKRLAELDKKAGLFEEHVEKNELNRHDRIGFREHDDGIDMSKITLARDNEEDLGEIDLDFNKNDSKGYGRGKDGELYAYNYPSQGVGAGIGSSAIGAGAGGGAGLGAGIGEGMLNGEAVPTLGGVGTGSPPLEGQPTSSISSGGVGGLVGGAGAGGAAGLTQGYIIENLGIEVGKGVGYGGRGGKGYNYDHLPKNGALHIIIHVDGSGSILATRKQLDIMKETLLKKALLPYYKNDEELYNKRVSIIDSSGERSLKFFNEAAEKDNVLAIAFQDEAAPDYHLPNFNKKPQDAYSYDLSELKDKLSRYNGLYRGVIFQVDRGRVFSKSFKEMVECAWNGEGYLSQENLKKYHRDNNLSNIKNKKGIVFSDEYHAKSEGDPKYYLDLIFKASKRVGLDLDIYGAGLSDGKYVKSD